MTKLLRICGDVVWAPFALVLGIVCTVILWWREIK